MRKFLAAVLSSIALAGLCSCGSAAAAPAGESLNVLELGATYGSWYSLDPLTDDTSAVNHDFFNAIYGELFEQGKNGAIIPDLATGFKTRDNGREVIIYLRSGVRFTDGMPFDSVAVAFNIRRDLANSAVCICQQNFSSVSAVTTAGSLEVILHLSQQDPSIIHAFFDEAPNWIVSPTALKKAGSAAFGVQPTGAGPFMVVSDEADERLVLTANPDYWQKGYPKLKTLTFISVADDSTAYEVLSTGQAQVYLDFGTPALLPEMKRKFDVTAIPATEAEAVNLNASEPPFGNILAREALYYATDSEALNQHIFDGAGLVSQSPGGPGDLFWNPVVPGYRTYDLTKAKALVAKLGGISFTLTALNVPLQETIAEALASEWRVAGIDASISILSIPETIQKTQDDSLQAIATEVGSYDPALSPGIASYYASTGPFSLLKDPMLDRMISAAVDEPDQARAGELYAGIFSYLGKRAYAPYLFTISQWNVASPSVTGLGAGLSEIEWQNVAISP
jgi:peptide/nickel transport system substrate-binding protein